jgi:hypothetical protein
VRPGLADEAQRYLAAVDAFRREGIAITWRAETHPRAPAFRGASVG